MELKDTVQDMLSPDYIDRFRAEYRQLKIRAEKLRKMLAKYEADTLDFEPECGYDLLDDQYELMDEYLRILETRAEIEGIEL